MNLAGKAPGIIWWLFSLEGRVQGGTKGGGRSASSKGRKAGRSIARLIGSAPGEEDFCVVMQPCPLSHTRRPQAFPGKPRPQTGASYLMASIGIADVPAEDVRQRSVYVWVGATVDIR